MKIAVFYNLNFGGAKRAAYDQVKLLVERGHLVDVYTTDDKTDMFDFSKVSSNFFKYKYIEIENKIPYISRLLNDLKTFYSLNDLHKKISKDIDRKKYDIILVHPDKITQSPYLLRHLKTRNAYYCQEPLRIVYEYVLRPNMNMGFGKYFYELSTRFIRKRIDLQNVRSATFTIASCYHIRERMIEVYGVYPLVSYLGIDINVFKPAKIKKQNQVFFVGNKNVWSDGYDLVESALKKIPTSIRPKLKIVEWVGKDNNRLSDEELSQQYSVSLATLCLSRLETFGLVPLESMSSGTPVIATRVSGHRETVIDGYGGYLVEFDPDEIAQKIIKLLENKKMQKNARQHAVSNWSWNKKIVEFEKLLSKLSN